MESDPSKHVNDNTRYKRITLRHGEHHFSIYCTDESYEHQYADVMRWARTLAHRLHWEDHHISVVRSSKAEATERLHALFEHRFRDK